MVHLTTALDASSGVPLYEQLYRSLAGEMRSGTLAAGTRMPGKRRLAAELSVSVNTDSTGSFSAHTATHSISENAHEVQNFSFKLRKTKKRY